MSSMRMLTDDEATVEVVSHGPLNMHREVRIQTKNGSSVILRLTPQEREWLRRLLRYPAQTQDRP